MKAVEIITDRSAPLSVSQLKAIESYADRLFDRIGIDVVFTNHFRDRINDPRNQEPITYGELVSFFNRAFKQQGHNISELDPESQAVLKDMEAGLNVPFVFNWTPEDGFTLVTKTIMRKPDFHTPNPVYQVAESVNHNITGETFADFLRHAVDHLKLDQLPRIHLVDRIEGQKSFAYFSTGPEGTEIRVATGGRHPADIMRSLAHELVHYRQALDGRELDGSTGSEIENEANAEAGVILRDFADRLFETCAGGIAGVAVPLGGVRRRKRKRLAKKESPK